jgi:hypothetical protein
MIDRENSHVAYRAIGAIGHIGTTLVIFLFGWIASLAFATLFVRRTATLFGYGDWRRARTVFIANLRCFYNVNNNTDK